MKKPLAYRGYLALAALSLAFGVPRAAQAAETKSLVVTTLTDVSNTNDNLTSLREAIAYANTLATNDTITFDVNGTITLGSSLSSVSSAASKGTLTIDGTGHTITVSGNSAVRILTVNSGGNLTLSHISLANGRVNSGAGGALVVSSGATLNVTASNITGSSASTNGGAISNSGTLNISNSTLSGNSAGGAGGAVYSTGALTVSNSTLAGNSAANGGAIDLSSSSSASISNSTISGNSASSVGGGIRSSTAAVSGSDPGTNLLINQSTISGNSAGAGGGIQNNQGLTVVQNSTITRNVAGINAGAGIRSAGASNVLTRLKNSIVADNRTSSGGADSGTDVDYTSSTNSFESGGYNAVGDGNAAATTFNGESTLTGLQLALGSLADNGGTTLTHALGTGSYAINAGDPSLNSGTDQRGSARVQGGRADIGAYETTNSAPSDLSITNASVPENAGNDATVGNFITIDADATDSHTYTLVTGAGDTDNSLFNIDGNSLRANSSFNFEADSSYTVRVRTTDSGNATFEKAFAITVDNVNEEPTDIQLSNDSIAENAGDNATVGTLTSTDPDTGETFTYSLVTGTGGDDNAAFTIGGTNDDELIAVSSFDFETKSSYSVRIRSTDAGGLFFEKPFTITVINGNEGPTAVNDSVETDENAAKVITLAGTDPENDSLTFNFTQPSHGTVTVAATLKIKGFAAIPLPGSHYDVLYTPDTNYFGSDSFTFTVNDGTTTSAPATVSITVLPETVIPTTSISAPNGGQNVLLGSFGPGSSFGTAADNIGVTSVEVKLSRNQNGVRQFWNGSAWVTDSAFVLASLSAPGGLTTDWTLNNIPAADQYATGAYSIVAAAKDAAGNTSLAAVRNFYIVEPGSLTISIDRPLANAILLPEQLDGIGIGGAVSANSGLKFVSAKLSRTVAGVKYFWNGITFTTDSSTSTASVFGGQWSIGVPPIEELDYGNYAVSVLANDVNGLQVTVTRAFTLVPETVAPSSKILNPAVNSRMLASTFAASTVNGTASDNAAVDFINVKLFRTVGGSKEYWTALGWASVSTNAPISASGLGTASATWSLSSLPTEGDLADGPYGVIAQVKDTSGNTTLSTVNFNIVSDATPPVVTIASPTANQKIKIADFKPATISGSATDVGGTVSSISVKLYRTISGVKSFWNGTEWTSASVAAPVNAPDLGTASTTWTLSSAPTSLDLVAGSYSIQASAKDSSGNTSTLATRNFVIEAPVATLKASPSGNSF